MENELPGSATWKSLPIRSQFCLHLSVWMHIWVWSEVKKKRAVVYLYESSACSPSEQINGVRCQMWSIVFRLLHCEAESRDNRLTEESYWNRCPPQENFQQTSESLMHAVVFKCMTTHLSYEVLLQYLVKVFKTAEELIRMFNWIIDEPHMQWNTERSCLRDKYCIVSAKWQSPRSGSHSRLRRIQQKLGFLQINSRQLDTLRMSWVKFTWKRFSERGLCFCSPPGFSTKNKKHWTQRSSYGFHFCYQHFHWKQNNILPCSPIRF